MGNYHRYRSRPKLSTTWPPRHHSQWEYILDRRYAWLTYQEVLDYYGNNKAVAQIMVWGASTLEVEFSIYDNRLYGSLTLYHVLVNIH